MVSIGVGIGLVAAGGLSRYLKGMLFGLTPLDPATFVAASVLFVAVALLASYVPARRATRIDPLVALRVE
jgi:ABC-type antimicrobial peptide transport system permease subunit